MGSLYLQHGKLKQAKKCFEHSLTLNSNQPLGWLGSGLIIEYVANSHISAKEANFDLHGALSQAKSFYSHAIIYGTEVNT